MTIELTQPDVYPCLKCGTALRGSGEGHRCQPGKGTLLLGMTYEDFRHLAYQAQHVQDALDVLNWVKENITALAGELRRLKNIEAKARNLATSLSGWHDIEDGWTMDNYLYDLHCLREALDNAG